ncbi:MAG: aminoacyl-tRNA hydrolase [Phycisphaerales bacterium]|nr:MAG: aminoacyl-tRNA hydrolase [Phycisphaerales bacterium]
MKVLVGLGNPEGQHAKTRHNAGFMVIDRLLARYAAHAPLKARFNSATVEIEIPRPDRTTERCLLMKPTTYMNRSGLAVGEAMRFYKVAPADLLVISDELYLPVGTVRLRQSGSPGGHNGLADISRVLGTHDYPRLRVGVGLKPKGGKPAQMDQADFVLSRFMDEEHADLSASLDRAAEACVLFSTRGIDAAMNVVNADPKSTDPKPSEPKPSNIKGAAARPTNSMPPPIPPA